MKRNEAWCWATWALIGIGAALHFTGRPGPALAFYGASTLCYLVGYR